MRILITAGPTREYIDSVRFLSNASSGRMGCAVASAAALAGHDVTLLLGVGASACLPAELAARIETVRFTSVADLKSELLGRFADCDALVMSAAVGDFRPEKTFASKLSRSAGPITLTLVPTEDLLAGAAEGKRPGQRIIAFAVEDGPREQIEAKARDEMQRKGADFVVVNTPAALAAEQSAACVLSPDGIAVPWATRPKSELAKLIVALI